MNAADFVVKIEDMIDNTNKNKMVLRDYLCEFIYELQDEYNINDIYFDAGAYLPIVEDYSTHKEVPIYGVSASDDYLSFNIGNDEWYDADSNYNFDIEDIFLAVKNWYMARQNMPKKYTKENFDMHRTLGKIGTILMRYFSINETDKLEEMIFDDEVSSDDVEKMLNRFKLIYDTCDGECPVIDKYCPKCGAPLYAETDLDIDYPYVCHECDENFYEFESCANSDKEKANPNSESEKPKRKYRIRYAMEMFVDAESEEDAAETFEVADLKDADFVEVEDISEY